jgi:hypothetical protein
MTAALPIAAHRLEQADACRRCGGGEGKLGPGKGPHAAAWLCARCGPFLAWISKRELSDLTQAGVSVALNRRGRP